VPTVFRQCLQYLPLAAVLPQDPEELARSDEPRRRFRAADFPATLPALSKAPLAVVAFFQLMYSWNDLLGPILYLTDQSTYTLTLGLQAYRSQQGGTEWHYLMAASVMTTLPIVLVFFLVQRAFFQGVSSLQNVEG
jgi:multiple sugar transport system permease protein